LDTGPDRPTQPAGNHAGGLSAKEGYAMTRRWNAAMQSLVLIRMGQELGTDSSLAQNIAHAIDFVIGTLTRFLC
jgi:hypothetical protein